MKELAAKIRHVLANRRRSRIWKRVAAGLMAVVVFCTTYALILPAITLEAETYCGVEEHTHTDACYTDAKYICDPTADADFVYHTHTDDCYLEGNPENTLICNLNEEQASHGHDDSCYDESGALVCGKYAVTKHLHSGPCTQTDDEGYALSYSCTDSLLNENKYDYILHVHDAMLCYDAAGTCICPLAGTMRHVHTDECYGDASTTETASSSDQSDVISAASGDDGGTLICTLNAQEAHEHTSECYDENNELICMIEENGMHAHRSGCYDGDGNLTCTLPVIIEHAHTDECCGGSSATAEDDVDAADSGDSEESRILTCSLTEHTHEESCYNEPSGYNFTAGGNGVTITVSLPYDAALPADLTCGIVSLGDSEDDADLDEFDEICDAVGTEIGEFDENEEYHASVYRLFWTLGGESYTLPDGSGVTVVIDDSESDTEGAYSLMGFVVAAADSSTVTSNDGDTAQDDGDDAAADDSSDADFLSSYTAESVGTDASSLSFALAAGEDFCIVRTSAATQTAATTAVTTKFAGGGYWMRITDENYFSNDTDESVNNYTYYSNTGTSLDGQYKYYMIVAANGNYRLTGVWKPNAANALYAAGMSTQINPIKGNSGCYTIQDSADCGGYITPDGHYDSNDNVLKKATDSIFHIFKNSDYGGSDSNRGCLVQQAYVVKKLGHNDQGEGGMYLAYGYLSSQYGDNIKLKFRTGGSNTWGFTWYNSNGATDRYLAVDADLTASNNSQAMGYLYQKFTSMDGYSLWSGSYSTQSSNIKTKSIITFDIGTSYTFNENTASSETDMMIFVWMPGTLNVLDEEKDSALLPDGDPVGETAYDEETQNTGVDNETVDLGNVIVNTTAKVASDPETSDINHNDDTNNYKIGDIQTTNNEATSTKTAAEVNAEKYAKQQEDDGRLVTDKSVIYNNDSYGVYGTYKQDEFSVTLSALAQEWEQVDPAGDIIQTPVDTMYVLEMSDDIMSSTNGYWDDCIDAINASMRETLADNKKNRVGLTIYAKYGYCVMPLERYGYDESSNKDSYNFITYTADSNTTIKVRTVSDPDVFSNALANESQVENYYYEYGNSKIQSSSPTLDGFNWNDSSTKTQVNMQRGLEAAYKGFPYLTGDDEGERIPNVILISNGIPSIATTEYQNPSVGPFYGNLNTSSSNTYGIIGYYSVLSAQYFKNVIGNKYQVKASFYTIAPTSSLNAYQTILLDPSRLSDYSDSGDDDTDGSAVQGSYMDLRRLLLADSETEGAGGSGGTYVEEVNTTSYATESGYGRLQEWMRGIYTPYKESDGLYKTGYDYSDGLYIISNSSQLTTDLSAILKSLELTNNYDFRTGGDNMITFTDTLYDNMTIQGVTSGKDATGSATNDAIRLLWYKTGSAYEAGATDDDNNPLDDKKATINENLVALEPNAVSTPTTTQDGNKTTTEWTYTWNNYTTYRTSRDTPDPTDTTNIYGNHPDSKSYGNNQTYEQTLSGSSSANVTNAITATVTTEVTTESDGSQKTKQTIVWKIPEQILTTLYADLNETFYYEEAPIRLVYKVGLADEEVTALTDKEEIKNKLYYVSDPAKPATAYFTYADGETAEQNPYYTDRGARTTNEVYADAYDYDSDVPDGKKYTAISENYVKELIEGAAAEDPTNEDLGKEAARQNGTSTSGDYDYTQYAYSIYESRYLITDTEAGTVANTVRQTLGNNGALIISRDKMDVDVIKDWDESLNEKEVVVRLYRKTSEFRVAIFDPDGNELTQDQADDVAMMWDAYFGERASGNNVYSEEGYLSYADGNGELGITEPFDTGLYALYDPSFGGPYGQAYYDTTAYTTTELQEDYTPLRLYLNATDNGQNQIRYKTDISSGDDDYPAYILQEYSKFTLNDYSTSASGSIIKSFRDLPIANDQIILAEGFGSCEGYTLRLVADWEYYLVEENIAKDGTDISTYSDVTYYHTDDDIADLDDDDTANDNKVCICEEDCTTAGTANTGCPICGATGADLSSVCKGKNWERLTSLGALHRENYDRYGVISDTSAPTMLDTTDTETEYRSTALTTVVKVGNSGLVTIKNTRPYTLPNTGGTGTQWFTLGGILLMSGAALAYIRRRRRNRCRG